MTLKMLALLLICSAVASAVSAQAPAPSAPVATANYTILCSNVLRPDYPFRVGVALFPRSADHSLIRVVARLSAIDKNSTADPVETVWQRESDAPVDNIDMSMTLAAYMDEATQTFEAGAKYNLTVTIQDTLGNRYVKSTELTLSESPVMTLIQTDKAVYKPGQLVKFRIVNLDETLVPVLSDMEIRIKDSRGNLVDKQTHNLTQLSTWSSKAVMTGQFQLSEMPNEGDWSITAKSDQFTETKTFNVRQYVLPKFTVELTQPDFVHFNDSEFTVEAKVQYTYDKAVEGTFNATIGPYQNCRYCKSTYDRQIAMTSEAEANGRASFTFNMTAWREALQTDGYDSRQYSFSARARVQFKEKYTGEIKMVEKTFQIYTKRYEVKVNTSQAPFFLPGFEVPVQIQLQRPDGEPFTGAADQTVLVQMVYHQRGKKRTKSLFQGSLIPAASGTGVSLSAKIPTTADFHAVKIEAFLEGSDSTRADSSSTIHPFIGVTDDYVKITKSDQPDNVQIELEKTSGIKFAYYAVLSRGQLQRWGRFPDSAKVTLSKAELDGYVADVTVVAFGVDKTGELVASVVKRDAGRLGGRITLSSNLTDNTGAPQEYAKVQVAAQPESFVFLTGIDASVNLLATGQDILQSTLTSKYNSGLVPLGRSYWPRSQRLTTGRIVQENGLIVLSDAFYYSEEDSNIAYMEGSGSRSRNLLGGSADSIAMPAPHTNRRMKTGGRGGGGVGGDTKQLRKFFPETMVWDMVQTDSEGRANKAFQLPDTITSWHISSFGVSSNSKIQTMDAAFKVTTIKDFFIRPVLPYSLVRAEKFILKVLAFNYRSEPAWVDITLNVTSSNADAMAISRQTESSADPATPLLPKVTMLLRANTGGFAPFELTPRGLPTLSLSINATCRLTTGGNKVTDIVEKSVIVKPEGKTVFKSRSVLLTPSANGSSSQDQSVSIDFPAADSTDLVSGSEVFRYSLIGDVMGPAMNNIGGLLRLPSGCGEQNMVNFAPGVFIWEYLTATKQESPELREKAMQVMKVGLQRQLTYQRRDGSYSAFGERDLAGSTWLTAFVLSTYARAASFIALDANSLTGKSVKFLLDQQTKNGQFFEPPGSRVLDRSLQGSSIRASHGMTAFVCLALLDVYEAAARQPDLKSTLWKDVDVRGSATKCLWNVKSAFASNPDAFNAYDAALSAYLLRRAQASTAFRQASLQRGLEALSSALAAQAETDTTGSGGKYWSTEQLYWSRKRPSVEATAWALLGATEAGDTEEGLQILRWLSNQQSSLGGFSSSHATVVGIRAMAAFAAGSGLVSGASNVQLEFNDSTRDLAVAEDRRLVLVQSEPLRGSAARVGSVLARHTSGPGFAMATLSWQYNLLDQSQLSADSWMEANGLGIKLKEANDTSQPTTPQEGQFRLGLCVRVNSSEAAEGMMILRVSHPSGFSAGRLPDPASIIGLKRVEAGAQEIVLYFDFLSTDGICLDLWWTRDVPVLELSPQQISLQMYYNAEQAVSATYLAPELQALTRCTACPECPGCARQIRRKPQPVDDSVAAGAADAIPIAAADAAAVEEEESSGLWSWLG